MRVKTVGLYAGLAAANLAAWGWAWTAFHGQPMLLGTALLAWIFGLRHAFDADHIAAIDNVVRKLMQDGERPLTVGLWFSLGHSTIVVLASLAIAVAAVAMKGRLYEANQVGAIVGTLVSAVFLLAIAMANMVVLGGVWHTFQKVRGGEQLNDDALDTLLNGRGFLARMFRPLFRLIRRSWQMYPIGFLFGLGFDTATEVGLLGIAATQAAQGISPLQIMVFPALFTAGMSLVDTTDSVVMVRAYGWAFVHPLHKLWYNLAMTATSVFVALVIGGIEVLGLLGTHFSPGNFFWRVIESLNGNFGYLGVAAIGLFVLGWVLSMVIFGWKRREWATAGAEDTDLRPREAEPEVDGR